MNAVNSTDEGSGTSLDQESRLTDGDHGALRLWLRLLTCTNLIEAHIRAQLRSVFDSTLPRFDLLAQLDRHPEGLRMGELSQRLMVTGGNVTGITDQLVGEGWVMRQDVKNDRRACVVKLTAKGKKAFAEMAQVHEQWIVHLMEGVPSTEQERLFALLGNLKSALKDEV
jgi:DNA-binding MarR family transcriptional regulator